MNQTESTRRDTIIYASGDRAVIDSMRFRALSDILLPKLRSREEHRVWYVRWRLLHYVTQRLAYLERARNLDVGQWGDSSRKRRILNLVDSFSREIGQALSGSYTESFTRWELRKLKCAYGSGWIVDAVISVAESRYACIYMDRNGRNSYGYHGLDQALYSALSDNRRLKREDSSMREKC